MSLSFEEINILGNIINDSFGKGSTNYGKSMSHYGGFTNKGPGEPSSVVTKATLKGEVLCVTSLAIINLTLPSTQHQEITRVEHELNQHVKSYISNVKKEFKKKENAGRALKCKQVKDSERNSVEMLNHYNANRPAIVRRSINFEVG